MAITFQGEWCYKNGAAHSNSSGALSAGRSGEDDYYVCVGKYYTDESIKAPSLMMCLYKQDNTSSSKYLGVFFSPCGENEIPNTDLISKEGATTLIGNFQTRLRFGYTWDNSNTSWIKLTGTIDDKDANYWAQGKTSASVILPRGYFFVYVATYQTDSTTHSELYRFSNESSHPAQLSATIMNKYTVSYASNGGTGTMTSDQKYHGLVLYLKSNEFSPPAATTSVKTITLKKNDGSSTNVGQKTVTNNIPKVFNKWKSTEGQEYIEYGEYTTDKSTIMTAQWENGEVDYDTVVLGTSSRDITSDQIVLTAQIDDEIDIQYPLTSTTSYTFSKWTSEQDGTGESYDSTTPYSFADNEILYAQYTPFTTYPSVLLPSNIVKDGYIFKGWSKDKNGVLINNNNYTPSGTETVYAVWEGETGDAKGMYIYTNGAWNRVVNFKIQQQNQG